MAHAPFLARLRLLPSEDYDLLAEARFDSHIVLGNVTDAQIRQVIENPSDDVLRLVRYARTICEGAERYTSLAEYNPVQSPQLPSPPPRLANTLATKPLALPLRRPGIEPRAAVPSTETPPTGETVAPSKATESAIRCLWKAFLSPGTSRCHLERATWHRGWSIRICASALKRMGKGYKPSAALQGAG